MNKHALAVAVGAALLGTGTALAAPFNSVDPRSMGMGGAGVAVANTATAPFFNPSLLAITNEKDDFAFELPMAGVRAYDPEDLFGSVDDFQEADLIGQIEVDISTAEATPTDSTGYHQIAADATLLASDPDVGFEVVNDKPIQAEAGLATVIGIPSKKFGTALVVNTWATVGGRARYSEEDKQVLLGLAADVEAFADCMDNPTPTCAAQPYTYVDPVTGDVTFDTSTLTSGVDVRGLMLAEVGLSFGREFTVLGAPIAFGITPKYVRATTIDYSATVENADQDDIQDENYTHEQTNFNVDLGVAHDFRNGWRGGLVVKNLLEQEYDLVYTDPTTDVETKTGAITLSPQARAGVSYQNNWLTAALDVDLTENDPVGFEDATRYVAIGTELNAADWAQLRLGYRVDTVNGERNVTSAGLGLSPFGVHLDMTVAGNANEIGAAVQFGFRF